MNDKDTLEKMAEIKTDIMSARQLIDGLVFHIDRAQVKLAVLYDEIENPREE